MLRAATRRVRPVLDVDRQMPRRVRQRDQIGRTAQMTGAPEHRHAVAMPGERHIDRVTVHPAVPEHQRVIHRHTLGFMDGCRIPVIKITEGRQIQRHRP